MHYQITCSCGRKHAVTVSQAGQNLTCSCGNSLAIPTLRGLKELPPADTAVAPAPRPIDAKPSDRPSILIGLLVTIFFLALPTTIFFAYQRLTMDTSNTEQADREIAIKQLDEASALMLSDAWTQYSSVALGLPAKPDFYYAEKKRKDTELYMAIAAGIALLSGLTAGAITAGKRGR
ncbi:MAG: hypothetical protein IT423_12150 [Pirellulaceae bacterium]|nr:hypothetical protein [Pirellulaceae bacterium]